MKSQSKKPSVADIINEYRNSKMIEEIWSAWGCVVVYRPAAVPLIYFLSRLGVAPNAVTLGGLCLLPLMLAAAYSADPDRGLLLVLALAGLYCTLDCVDGPLARLQNRSSAFGQFIDFAADVAYRVVAYVCLGLLADRLAPPPQIMQLHGWSWLSVMLFAAWLTIFVRLCRTYADAMFAPAEPAAPTRDLSAIVFAVLSGTDILLPLIALGCWWFGVLDLLVVWLLFYTAMDVAYALPAILLRLHRSA
jgi:phosphatidylglycerophosphate synthase